MNTPVQKLSRNIPTSWTHWSSLPVSAIQDFWRLLNEK